MGTNHCGDDLYRFQGHATARSPSFYLRQTISSVNFGMGTDPIDFVHGWLNYQIEHHLWPNLSMLSYQRAHPRVKAICAKYNIPFIQQNCFSRIAKTMDIMVGVKSMRKYPMEFECKDDLSTEIKM